jgi:N-acetyl-anhydromuramyl-L-alanine amidase AmpD
LHATVGGLLSSLKWLTNAASRVSSHYVIAKSGIIYQLVPDDQAAWHAGASRWNNMDADDIQRQSIGIELQNANSGRDPYPRVQVDAALELARSLTLRYRIPHVNVVRHLDIAIPYGRKTDPAGFPWALFRARLGISPGHYRVRARTTANVRSGPYLNTPVVATLHAGDAWDGVEVAGSRVTLAGYRSNALWIVNEDGRAVWSSLLEAA